MHFFHHLTTLCPILLVSSEASFSKPGTSLPNAAHAPQSHIPRGIPIIIPKPIVIPKPDPIEPDAPEPEPHYLSIPSDEPAVTAHKPSATAPEASSGAFDYLVLQEATGAANLLPTGSTGSGLTTSAPSVITITSYKSATATSSLPASTTSASVSAVFTGEGGNTRANECLFVHALGVAALMNHVF